MHSIIEVADGFNTGGPDDEGRPEAGEILMRFACAKALATPTIQALAITKQTIMNSATIKVEGTLFYSLA